MYRRSIYIYCGNNGKEGVNMAIDKSLVSGSMAMLILQLLEERDLYGYEMIETLRGRSNRVFELKAGTLYPLLHSLEEKGLVTAYEQEVSGKMRKYYSITKEGNHVLKKKKEEWKEYSKGVQGVIGGLAYGYV